MTNRGGFGGDGFSGGLGRASMVQNFRFSEAVEHSTGSASTPLVGGLTCGQQFMVLRDSICTGVDVTWGTSGADETLTVELWDDGGLVLATATCVVSGTARRQTVNWAAPINLPEDDLLGKLLVVSAFQGSADEYYSDIGATLITAAAPQIVGPGVISYGNIYVAGHAFPVTNTAAETYGLDANLRSILHGNSTRAGDAGAARGWDAGICIWPLARGPRLLRAARRELACEDRTQRTYLRSMVSRMRHDDGAGGDAVKRVLVGALLSLVLACGSTRGVWVRVAETTCSGIVELLGEDDTRTALCLVAVDLVRLLDELRAAESSGRGAIVYAVDGAGVPITVEVPARHVPAAVLSVRTAMGAR